MGHAALMCAMQRSELLTYVVHMKPICISVGLNPLVLGVKHCANTDKAIGHIEDHCISTVT